MLFLFYFMIPDFTKIFLQAAAVRSLSISF
ncbi:hypothetical protein [Bacillus phage FI_KG-Lek]|nr:hypothetical protein [Bacillus phage FI_KG-Lek]